MMCKNNLVSLIDGVYLRKYKKNDIRLHVYIL